MVEEFFGKMKKNQMIKRPKVLILIVGLFVCLLLLYMLNSSTGKLLDSTPVSAQQQYQGSEFEMLLSQINGAGQTNAYINKDNDTGEVKGVIIVSQGAEDIRVKLMLATAASTALNVPMDKIEVFEMQKGE